MNGVAGLSEEFEFGFQQTHVMPMLLDRFEQANITEGGGWVSNGFLQLVFLIASERSAVEEAGRAISGRYPDRFSSYTVGPAAASSVS